MAMLFLHSLKDWILTATITAKKCLEISDILLTMQLIKDLVPLIQWMMHSMLIKIKNLSLKMKCQRTFKMIMLYLKQLAIFMIPKINEESYVLAKIHLQGCHNLVVKTSSNNRICKFSNSNNLILDLDRPTLALSIKDWYNSQIHKNQCFQVPMLCSVSTDKPKDPH